MTVRLRQASDRSSSRRQEGNRLCMSLALEDCGACLKS